MKKISIRQLRTISSISIILYSILYVIGIRFLQPKNEWAIVVVSDIFTIIGDFSAVFLIFVCLYRFLKRNKIAWFFFLCGLILNAFANLIWIVYEWIYKISPPFPSISDIFYYSGSLLIFLAFFSFFKEEKQVQIIRIALDFAITVVVSSTLLIYYVMTPVWTSQSLSTIDKFVSLSYPIIDLAYIAGMFSLFYLSKQEKRLTKRNLLLTLAFLCWFVADQIYAIGVNNYSSGIWFDPLWPIGSLLIALAILYSTEDIYQKKAKEKASLHRTFFFGKLTIEDLQFLLPYIASLGLIIFLTIKSSDESILYAGAFLTVILSILRQIITYFDNKHLFSLLKETNDLLEQSQYELELQYQKQKEMSFLHQKEANTDFLTGLSNRRFVNQFFHTSLLSNSTTTSSLTQEIELCVLLIDVDYFKGINDTYGHDAGDLALVSIATMIKENIRYSDIAGRFGGDEFIIIMPHTSMDTGKAISERLRRQAVLIDYSSINDSMHTTLSIGGVHWLGTREQYSFQKLVTKADQALYISKANGRNCSTSLEFTPS